MSYLHLTKPTCPQSIISLQYIQQSNEYFEQFCPDNKSDNQIEENVIPLSMKFKYSSIKKQCINTITCESNRKKYQRIFMLLKQSSDGIQSNQQSQKSSRKQQIMLQLMPFPLSSMLQNILKININSCNIANFKFLYSQSQTNSFNQQFISLTELYLDNNYIIEIENIIYKLVNLKTLSIDNNLLKTIKGSLIFGYDMESYGNQYMHNNDKNTIKTKYMLLRELFMSNNPIEDIQFDLNDHKNQINRSCSQIRQLKIDWLSYTPHSVKSNKTDHLQNPINLLYPKNNKNYVEDQKRNLQENTELFIRVILKIFKYKQSQQNQKKQIIQITCIQFFAECFKPYEDNVGIISEILKKALCRQYPPFINYCRTLNSINFSTLKYKQSSLLELCLEHYPHAIDIFMAHNVNNLISSSRLQTYLQNLKLSCKYTNYELFIYLTQQCILQQLYEIHFNNFVKLFISNFESFFSYILMNFNLQKTSHLILNGLIEIRKTLLRLFQTSVHQNPQSPLKNYKKVNNINSNLTKSILSTISLDLISRQQRENIGDGLTYLLQHYKDNQIQELFLFQDFNIPCQSQCSLLQFASTLINPQLLMILLQTNNKMNIFIKNNKGKSPKCCRCRLLNKKILIIVQKKTILKRFQSIQHLKNINVNVNLNKDKIINKKLKLMINFNHNMNKDGNIKSIQNQQNEYLTNKTIIIMHKLRKGILQEKEIQKEIYSLYTAQIVLFQLISYIDKSRQLNTHLKTNNVVYIYKKRQNKLKIAQNSEYQSKGSLKKSQNRSSLSFHHNLIYHEQNRLRHSMTQNHIGYPSQSPHPIEKSKIKLTLHKKQHINSTNNHNNKNYSNAVYSKNMIQDEYYGEDINKIDKEDLIINNRNIHNIQVNEINIIQQWQQRFHQILHEESNHACLAQFQLLQQLFYLNNSQTSNVFSSMKSQSPAHQDYYYRSQHKRQNKKYLSFSTSNPKDKSIRLIHNLNRINNNYERNIQLQKEQQNYYSQQVNNICWGNM